MRLMGLMKSAKIVLMNFGTLRLRSTKASGGNVIGRAIMAKEALVRAAAAINRR